MASQCRSEKTQCMAHRNVDQTVDAFTICLSHWLTHSLFDELVNVFAGKTVLKFSELL